MITGSEILMDLEKVKKKAEFAEITYSNNDVWSSVNERLQNIIYILKNDMKIFGYE